jgi:hypothetical protein
MELPVEQIPLPWKYFDERVVVRLEYPPDRPLVVDLVFSDGIKTAETKNTIYDDTRGYWTSVRYPLYDDGTIDEEGIEAAAFIHHLLGTDKDDNA